MAGQPFRTPAPAVMALWRLRSQTSSPLGCRGAYRPCPCCPGLLLWGGSCPSSELGCRSQTYLRMRTTQAVGFCRSGQTQEARFLEVPQVGLRPGHRPQVEKCWPRPGASVSMWSPPFSAMGVDDHAEALGQPSGSARRQCQAGAPGGAHLAKLTSRSFSPAARRWQLLCEAFKAEANRKSAREHQDPF